MRRYRHVIKPTGLAALLALLIALGGQPFLHAEAPGTRAPFCREDGVCLPAPRLIIPDVTSAQTDLYGPIAGEACEEAVLVKRAGDVTPQAFGRLLAARGYAHVEGLLTPGWWRVCLPYAEGTTAAAAQAAVSALESLPEMALVEHDGLAHAADTLLPWDLGPSDRRGVQLRAPQGPAYRRERGARPRCGYPSPLGPRSFGPARSATPRPARACDRRAGRPRPRRRRAQ